DEAASTAPAGRWVLGWERATPMALFLSITHPMSAIGVARSQRKSSPARFAALAIDQRHIDQTQPTKQS
ncbi:hypothetical protein, partial [Reyranella sp.]|uniref:hypothetical protein n=1 Tax=Reyranella sp. TaxID=1929291 RepID=UPI003D0A668E